MTENDLFKGASVIISIKATHEIRDESGFTPIEQTKGELVLTEKEFVFLEVKGTFKKEKKRLHASAVEKLRGYHYERWNDGDTFIYLTFDNESGLPSSYLYVCRKRDSTKFIETIKEQKLI